MASRKAVDMGYYPISMTDVRAYIRNCEKWEYDNKDTCKYVAEAIIEKLERENPELPILDTLYCDLISMTHRMVNGRGVLRIKIKYKV